MNLMAATTGKSLGDEFHAGQKLYNKIENTSLASSDPLYQQDVKNAITHFMKCAELTSKLNIFSANETVEDINTGDLRFLLVEACLGDLVTKLVDGDRMQILNKAKSYLEQFLWNVELHEILKEEDRKLVEEQSNEVTKNAAKRREEKIARYKREKETKVKLETLQQLLSSIGDNDEDVSRKYVLTLIDLFIQKSIEQLSSIKQEFELLDQMRKMQEQSGPSSFVGLTDDNKVENISKDTSGPLLTKDGKPLRTFVITNQREAIREQVFRPGWSLPTMTIDEYLEQEAAQGNIISGGGQIPEKKEIDDNDEQSVDKETYKAREWDEFKDTNPRGWGNRMRKG